MEYPGEFGFPSRNGQNRDFKLFVFKNLNKGKVNNFQANNLLINFNYFSWFFLCNKNKKKV